MGGKQMEGSPDQKRAAAREAAKHGKRASEVGGTTGASKQRTESKHAMSHQETIDLKREGKQGIIEQNTPTTRPGSRDPDTPDRQKYPRM